jgi:hypothetical protein
MTLKILPFKTNPSIITAILTPILFILTTQTTVIAAQPQVATGMTHTVGLKSDGTVVATGCNSFNYDQCDVFDWNLIIPETLTSKAMPFDVKRRCYIATFTRRAFFQMNKD